MRVAFASLVVATACSGTAGPPDAPPRQLQLDVVIANGAVALYTSESDLAETGCIGGNIFPGPGMNAFVDDIVTCPRGQPMSCLTGVALVIGNATITAQAAPGRTYGMAGDVEAAGGGHLLIEGCGGNADIALPVEAAPQPTLIAHADTTAGTVTATWSAVPTASSALVEINDSISGELTHTTSSPTTFTLAQGIPVDAYHSATVTAFAPPTTVTTAYGTARIWTGASAFAQIQ